MIVLDMIGLEMIRLDMIWLEVIGLKMIGLEMTGSCMIGLEMKRLEMIVSHMFTYKCQFVCFKRIVNNRHIIEIT